MNAKKLLAMFCVAVFLNGFSSGNIFGQENNKPKPTEVSPTQSQQSVGDDISDNQFAPKSQNDRYRIGYEDAVEIQVFHHPELSRVASISPDGTILMPRINAPITAVCKTERELGESIGTLYKSYLRNPFVTVRVVDQRSQPFAVIGAVEKPGPFYLNRPIRLSGLLALAGGPKVEKAGAKIQVARVGNISGCEEKNTTNQNDDVEFFSYKLKDVRDNKENPWLQPGDIVNVLEAELVYVVGNVVKPTQIPLKDTITLTEAIAAGGGLAPEAKTDKVTIQRQDAQSSLKTETVYDLKDIRDKKIADPVLQANDIVNVPKDSVKSARNSLLKALSGGIGGLFYGL